MLRRNILPALSMVKAQSILAVDIWNILKNYDTSQRWQLYAEWSTQSYRDHPTLGLRSKEVNREVKNLLRRLSHENVEKHIMTMTKIAHSNPYILFRVIVTQVQAYDNMIPELIKVLGRVTILPLDVLTFVLVDAFSQPDKEHVKDDGISITDWLTSEHRVMFIAHPFELL
jgi:THO complex subunit 2